MKNGMQKKEQKRTNNNNKNETNEKIEKIDKKKSHFQRILKQNKMMITLMLQNLEMEILWWSEFISNLFFIFSRCLATL